MKAILSTISAGSGQVCGQSKKIQIMYSRIHISSPPNTSYQKPDCAIIDILDKSENKSEEMIDILQYIHEKCIARLDSEN